MDCADELRGYFLKYKSFDRSFLILYLKIVSLDAVDVLLILYMRDFNLLCSPALYFCDREQEYKYLPSLSNFIVTYMLFRYIFTVF